MLEIKKTSLIERIKGNYHNETNSYGKNFAILDHELLLAAEFFLCNKSCRYLGDICIVQSIKKNKLLWERMSQLDNQLLERVVAVIKDS